MARTTAKEKLESAELEAGAACSIQSEDRAWPHMIRYLHRFLQRHYKHLQTRNTMTVRSIQAGISCSRGNLTSCSRFRMCLLESEVAAASDWK